MAMRLVYAAVVAHESADEMWRRTIAMPAGKREEMALADSLTCGIVRVYDLRCVEIEKWIAEEYGRALNLMTMIERAAISAAVAEMLSAPQTPTKVIINETIEILKRFGTDGGHLLANGILDGIAKRLSQQQNNRH